VAAKWWWLLFFVVLIKGIACLEGLASNIYYFCYTHFASFQLHFLFIYFDSIVQNVLHNELLPEARDSAREYYTRLTFSF